MYIRLTLPTGSHLNLDIIKNTYQFTEVLYNELKPVDNSVKCSVPFSVELSNAIQSYINNDIGAVLYDDNSTPLFTGYLRKSATLSKATKNGVISIELVPATYIINSEYGSNNSYTAVKIKAVIEHLLQSKNVNVTVLNCPDITVQVVKLESASNVLTVITDLLFEYGYVFTFNADGNFECVKLFNTMPNLITQKFADASGENPNMFGSYQQTVKERQYYSVTASFNELSYKTGQVIYYDESSKEVESGSYLFGNPNGEYLDYDCDGVQGVEYIDNASIQIVASGQYTKTFTNYNTKGHLVLKNTSSSKINVTKIKVTGDGYFITSSSSSKAAEGKKQRNISLKYVFTKNQAENLVQNVNNYYRYSSKTLQLKSKTDYDLGSYCTVTAEGSGTYTARIIKKVYTLTSDLIQYELESVTEFTPATVVTESVHTSFTYPAESVGTPIPCLNLSTVHYNADSIINIRCVISDGSNSRDYPSIITVYDSEGNNVYTSINPEISYSFTASAEKSFYKVTMTSVDGIFHDEQKIVNTSENLLILTNEYQNFESDGIGFSTSVKCFYDGVEKSAEITSVICPSTFSYQTSNNSVYVEPKGDVKTDGTIKINAKAIVEDPVVIGSSDFVIGSSDFVIGRVHYESAELLFKYGNFDVSCLRPSIDQRIDDVVDDIGTGLLPVYTGRYIGSFTSVAVIPTTSFFNDFFLWSGATTQDLTQGELYYWDGSSWARDTDTEHMSAAMTDMLNIVDSLPSDSMVKLFVDRLCASSVFVSSLFTKLITLQSPGLIKSSNYDAQAQTGFQIGSDGHAVFNDVEVRGSGSFSGEVNATSGTFDQGTFTNGTFTGTIHANDGDFAGTVTLKSGKSLRFADGSNITNISVSGTTMEITIS